MSEHGVPLHCMPLHCIALNRIALPCIALHYTASTALYCIALYYTVLQRTYCTPPHYTAPHHTTYPCTLLYSMALEWRLENGQQWHADGIHWWQQIHPRRPSCRALYTIIDYSCSCRALYTIIDYSCRALYTIAVNYSCRALYTIQLILLLRGSIHDIVILQGLIRQTLYAR